jgi:hypothetical protein
VTARCREILPLTISRFVTAFLPELHQIVTVVTERGAVARFVIESLLLSYEAVTGTAHNGLVREGIAAYWREARRLELTIPKEQAR